ncbi:MAG: hypothetical protein V2J07_02080 [Anaerolineae bacterium]|jgi:hypothetical protein|nr:hypothetical protein [Anaerolineae bacterium]
MIAIDFLSKGLAAMARAHRVNTMSGHLGAAVVAGYFIGELHPNLDDRIFKGIEAEFERIMRGESVFSPGETAGITAGEMFEDFPKEAPQEHLIEGIAEALADNIDQTHESGHNVIFASIAIRALKDHPDLAMPAVVQGIRKLIVGFDGSSPGSGYYGKEKGRIDGRKIPLTEDDSFPPYPNLESMANTVLDELVENAAQRRQGFGGLVHVINHAAALVELANYGYPELARQGLPAHHQHLQLFRTLPDLADELETEDLPEEDPRTPAFWESGSLRRNPAFLTHRIKTIYGFDTLIQRVEDTAKHQQGNHNLRYFM